VRVATVEECRVALERLGERMAAKAAEGSRIDFDRSLSCRISDLDVGFHGDLVDGRITNIAAGENPKAKVKLAAGSDDLVALVDGRLNAASAWASGRIKIDASLMDLMKLRKLL
jgi:putative sterol carrier protein